MIGAIIQPVAQKLSYKNPSILMSVIIALGIVYGDIGTSPLYVMRAIVGGKTINEFLVYGALSCVFWTLTLQTTLKYIVIILRVDRKGQGGILSLYSLIKGKKWWIVFFAIAGASMLLSEGIITPAISVSSAVEGLRIIYPNIETLPIVITILLALFSVQRFGTNIVGGLFGFVMLIWFSMIGLFGIDNFIDNIEILKAINPIYAIELLIAYPGGFWILGAVFLCTTGAEALYSDLGHCDRRSIRIGWAFVKICLLLNYFGQGSWLLQNNSGQILDKSINPFYAMVPEFLLLPAIFIATFATIIASQALISGSFSLINEANRLNLWPKFRTLYPATSKGQIYIPAINFALCIGCIGVTYYFKESANMEAAYGLAVVTAMINTTILFLLYMSCRKYPKLLIFGFGALYLTIEISFLIANMAKFIHGGWIVFLGGFLIFFTMWMWYQAKIFKRRHTKYSNIEEVLPTLVKLTNDKNIPKIATHLVYMTSSSYEDEVETKIMYSLLDRQPKRADIYWFVHVEIVDEPYICDYKVNIMSKDAVRVDFRLGFKIEPRINLLFKKVVAKLISNKEIKVKTDYQYKEKQNIFGDISFVILRKFIANKHYLPLHQRIVINLYSFIKKLSIGEEQSFGIDDEPNSVIIEQIPITFKNNNRNSSIKLNRVYE